MNIVFMAENAPHLDQTVAAFADLGIPKINLLQYHFFDERGAASDPCRVLSRTQIDDLLARIRAVARKKIAVFFDLIATDLTSFSLTWPSGPTSATTNGSCASAASSRATASSRSTA